MLIHVAGACQDGQVKEVDLEMPDGATAAMAAESAAMQFGLVPPQEGALAIWGRRTDAGRVLREGDRVEITESLRIDPNEARRLRAERASDKTAASQGRHGGKHRLL